MISSPQVVYDTGDLLCTFLQLVEKAKELLKDSDIKRWYNLSITYAQGENS